jgi:hypothetical protein
MKRYQSFLKSVFKGKDERDIIEKNKVKAEKGWIIVQVEINTKFMFSILISRFRN